MLQTDASGTELGATLFQMVEEGNDREIAFYSRKLLLQLNYRTAVMEVI